MGENVDQLELPHIGDGGVNWHASSGELLSLVTQAEIPHEPEVASLMTSSTEICACARQKPHTQENHSSDF